MRDDVLGILEPIHTEGQTVTFGLLFGEGVWSVGSVQRLKVPIAAGKKQQRDHDQPHAEAVGMTQDRIRKHPCARRPLSFGALIRHPGGHRGPRARRPERLGGRYGQGPAYG